MSIIINSYNTPILNTAIMPFWFFGYVRRPAPAPADTAPPDPNRSSLWNLSGMGMPVPRSAHPNPFRGRELEVEYPREAFRVYLTKSSIGGDKEDPIPRGTYFVRYDAVYRIRQLRMEACKQGWKLLDATTDSWKVQMDSRVVWCQLEEVHVHSEKEQADDWRYRETVFDEDPDESDYADSEDDLTG